MKNNLDPWLAKSLESTCGGDGDGPQHDHNGGVTLTLSARKLIQDYLQTKVDEINAAEGDEQQRLIDALPPVFRDAVKVGKS